MWGKPHNYILELQIPRTIPTRVGKTFIRVNINNVSADHPHACGENHFRGERLLGQAGPSPRVWGKHYRAVHRQCNTRTIPTRVGKTQYGPMPHCSEPDHPHACGENLAEFEAVMDGTGPSPRVWGKPFVDCRCWGSRRTIPTRVGKTLIRLTLIKSTADHPHACGENPMCGAILGPVDGPSPRVWGKPQAANSTKPQTRTIPTRVGKTHHRVPASVDTTDHPHACGENCGCLPACIKTSGPSPRVWGKRNHANHTRKNTRTIPTRVGKTESSAKTHD